MFWIIAVAILIVLIFVFARSADKEAKRISREVDFRIDSIDLLCKSLDVDDREAERLERKAARYKARAEEVASRQSPAWRAYSRTVRRSNKA